MVTGVRIAVIDIDFAVEARVANGTVTRVVVDVVSANTSVQARVRITVIYLPFTASTVIAR